MWAKDITGESFKLYKAAEELSKVCLLLKIAIDGGKDSLSMYVKKDTEEQYIISPGQLVLTGYAPTKDIRKIVTPNIKEHNSLLCFVDMSFSCYNLGGSSVAQVFNQLGMLPTSTKTILAVKSVFNVIQKLIGKKRNDVDIILSGHDRSDGGLITTILEMCFSGGYGCILNVHEDTSWLNYFFNESPGIVLEIHPDNKEYITEVFSQICPITWLGRTCLKNTVKIRWR